MTDEHPHLWALVSKLERQCVDEWRAEHYPALDLEQALARRMITVETTVARSREGNISVTVSLIAVAPRDHAVRFFPLQRTANRMWKRAES